MTKRREMTKLEWARHRLAVLKERRERFDLKARDACAKLSDAEEDVARAALELRQLEESEGEMTVIAISVGELPPPEPGVVRFDRIASAWPKENKKGKEHGR